MKIKVHKFIDPLTDFGFKKLFGEEASKDFLIAFLNSILPEKHQIKDITFMPTVYAGENEENRKLIYDIQCVSTTGETFIVEMQRARMHFFIDRSLFYVARAISQQPGPGDWDFQLKPTYLIAILDFQIDKNVTHSRYKTSVTLKDDDGVVFYDNLNFCFIELPYFNKKEDELETHFDKWLFFLKNLEDFNDLPAALNEPIFKKALEVARKANMSNAELEAYNKNKKEYLDVMNIMESMKLEAQLEAREEERNSILINLLKNTSLTIEEIAKSVRVSIDYVKEIAEKLKRN